MRRIRKYFTCAFLLLLQSCANNGEWEILPGTNFVIESAEDVDIISEEDWDGNPPMPQQKKAVESDYQLEAMYSEEEQIDILSSRSRSASPFKTNYVFISPGDDIGWGWNDTQQVPKITIDYEYQFFRVFIAIDMSSEFKTGAGACEQNGKWHYAPMRKLIGFETKFGKYLEVRFDREMGKNGFSFDGHSLRECLLALEPTAEVVAKNVQALIDQGITCTAEMQIIGFGYGAYLAGMVARVLNKSGKNQHKVHRVSGIEPIGVHVHQVDGDYGANPKELWLTSTQSNLKDTADLVDVYYSDLHYSFSSKFFGTRVLIGNTNIICRKGRYLCDTIKECSHRISLAYFLEAFLTKPLKPIYVVTERDNSYGYLVNYDKNSYIKVGQWSILGGPRGVHSTVDINGIFVQFDCVSSECKKYADPHEHL